MADYRYCQGQFTRPAGAVGQTVAVSDACGTFTPKVVLLWGTVQAADGFDDTGVFAFGWDTGSSRFGICVYATDLDSPGFARACITQSASVVVNTSAATLIQDTGHITATANGSFTFTWDVGASSFTIGSRWNFLALGGADLSVAIGQVSDPASTGDVTTTIGSLTGKQLTGLLLMSSIFPSGNMTVPGLANCVEPVLGWTDGTHQGAIACKVSGFGAPGTPYREQLTNQLMLRLNGGAFSTNSTAAALGSLGTGQFTLHYSTTTTGPTGQAGFNYLAIAGPSVNVGAALSATSVTLSPGFIPGCGLFATVGAPSSSSVQTELRYSFGATDGPHQAGTWIGSLAGADPTITARRLITNSVVTCATPTDTGSASTLVGNASVTINTNSTAVLNFSTVPATPVEVLYFLLQTGDNGLGTYCSAPITNGSIRVTKVTTPIAGGPFVINAGGGLSPTTVSLSNGDSYTFTNVTPASGYTIDESPPVGWSLTGISVSNGSDHDNITVASGETVVVTVTNASTQTVTTRKIRRRRQGPHMSNEQQWAFHKKLQIDMEVGVGDSDAPAPTGTLKWSDDGGYTWSSGITGALGAAAAYLTRVIFWRLGRSRDRVYRWDIDDPVKVALINGYTDVEPGNGA